MRRILKRIHVIQEVDNQKRTPRLGRGFMKAYRFNPYNPLSYLFLVIAAIVGLIMFGIIGVWEGVGRKNPFKWD